MFFICSNYCSPNPALFAVLHFVVLLSSIVQF
jgi:hypothetical protein